ncbi:MAG: hypothetical protein AT710_01005 [Thermocladium sp. ECH_B]|nr:MAG: hypothetical protein AT710_01005 [Thermocladium sp. ECH_B]
MGIHMIDVTNKEAMYREATASGFLELRGGLARDASSGFTGLGNVISTIEFASVMATKKAWQFVGLLHPIELTYIRPIVTLSNSGINVRVTARTLGRTGVEMDALFGSFIGLLAAWNVVKAKYCLCSGGKCEPVLESPGSSTVFIGANPDIVGIRDIRVESKVKSINPIEGEESATQLLAPPIVFMFDATDEPLYRGEALSRGKIMLGKKSIDLIRSNKVEKGDVRTTAQLAGMMAAKKAWDLLPLVHNNDITDVRVGIDLEEDGVSVAVLTKNISRTGSAMESLLAAGVSLLTVWDMVKKYEKDENGQYPYTRISSITLEKSEKHPLT